MSIVKNLIKKIKSTSSIRILITASLSAQFIGLAVGPVVAAIPATLFGRSYDSVVLSGNNRNVYRGYFHGGKIDVSSARFVVLSSYLSAYGIGAGGTVTECNTYQNGSNTGTTFSGVNGADYDYDADRDPKFQPFAIPSCIDSPEEFIAFLIKANSLDFTASSFNKRRVIGSALIVNTMLGRNGPGQSSNFDQHKVKSEDFTSLLNLLNFYDDNGLIDWHVSTLEPDGINSMTALDVSGNIDVFYHDHGSARSGIRIKDASNKAIYRIWRYCANPVGGNGNLNTWAVVTKTWINKDTVYQGDELRWTHNIRNVGPNNTNAAVTYASSDHPYTGLTGTVAAGTRKVLSSNTASSATYENSTKFYSYYSVPDDAVVGSQICRATAATPSAFNDSTIIVSDVACATVLKKPINWIISPSTEIYVGGAKRATATVSSGEKVVNVSVDDNVSWINAITNTGTTATDQTITYRYRNDSQALKDRAGTDQGVIHSLGSLGVLASDSFPSYLISLSPFKIKPEDVNKKFCRNTIAYQKSSSNRDDPVSSDNACAYVPYDYNLTPTIGINPSGSAAVGQDIIITPKVYNNGPTDSDARGWSVRVTINGAYQPDHKTGNGQFPVSVTTDLISPNYTVGSGLIPGDKLCFILWLDKSSPSGGPIASIPACVVIGKIPNIQVWGGDVWARDAIKGVQAHSTSASSTLFGSWAEYGILTDGPIVQMGSKSAFANSFSALGTVCEYSILSFTNADCSSNVGHYAISRNVPDIKSNFASATNILPSNNLSGLNGKYKLTASDFEIVGGDIAAGNSVVIYAPDTSIKISGDIKYTSGLVPGNVQSIPQVVIIAKNIFIAENVENIDAWLMAGADASGNGGVINTCAYNAGGAVIDPNTIRISYTGVAVNCDKKLTVNGPVASKKLLLFRTNGADSISGYANAAEVFNLRADAYLWAAAQSTSGTSIKTVYTIEQPPRF